MDGGTVSTEIVMGGGPMHSVGPVVLATATLVVVAGSPVVDVPVAS